MRVDSLIPKKSKLTFQKNQTTMTAVEFNDPADRAIDDSVRCKLYEDLHEDETPEDMAARLEREAYCEASRKLLPIILGTLNYILEGKRSDDILFRLAIVSQYFGHPVYAGKSMADICTSFNKTRAAGSHAILKFQRSNHLPELIGQKQHAARATYHDRRKESITCKNN
jgi:hypothetical protein